MLASDLHLHLDGSIRESTLLEMAGSAGLLPSTVDAADFLRRLRFRPGMTLPACLERFEVTVGLLQTRRALTRVAAELVADCYRDGVRHTEIRFCPALHTREGLTPAQAVEAVLDGTERGSGDVVGGDSEEWLTARVIVSVLEGMTEAEAGELVDLAIGHAGAGVVAVDLAGDESLFDASRYEKALRRASDAGLYVTVHAGEGSDASHVIEAVTRLRADRIGHGVSAATSPEAMALLADKGVAVEICLSSNLHTSAVSSLSKHPLGALSKAGVPVVICTDNRFFSETTLSSEYEIAASEVGVGRDVTEGSILAGAEHAFLPAGERERLRSVYEASLGGQAE